MVIIMSMAIVAFCYICFCSHDNRRGLLEVGGNMEKSSGEKNEQERLSTQVWFLKTISIVQ